MNRPIPFENRDAKANATPPALSSALEGITAFVLGAVLLSLAWMVLAAFQPRYFRLFSIETEIIIILALLLTALVLVSIVALQHTRSD